MTHVATVDGHADDTGDVLLGGDEGDLDKLALGGKVYRRQRTTCKWTGHHVHIPL